MPSLIILIVGFIGFSGMLALVDAAILSVSRAEVEELVLQRSWGSQPLKWVTKHITRSVVVIVIATNIVNVLGPILVGKHAIDLFGSDVIGIITAILTFGTIIFSEIIPKSLGSHYAPTIGRIVAPVIIMFIYGLYPLVLILEKVAKYFQTGTRVFGTEAQIQSLVTLGSKAGHIEADEGQLIQRAFILNDRLAKDIMVTQKDIVGVEEEMTVREAADIVFANHYSRYPLYKKSLDHISGLVMSKDILEALASGLDNSPAKELGREVLSVPAGKRADDLLVLFRNRSIHLAIVRENNTTIGLVTLEDVLEELVGEIEDESDIDVTPPSHGRSVPRRQRPPRANAA